MTHANLTRRQCGRPPGTPSQWESPSGLHISHISPEAAHQAAPGAGWLIAGARSQRSRRFASPGRAIQAQAAQGSTPLHRSPAPCPHRARCNSRRPTGSSTSVCPPGTNARTGPAPGRVHAASTCCYAGKRSSPPGHSLKSHSEDSRHARGIARWQGKSITLHPRRASGSLPAPAFRAAAFLRQPSAGNRKYARG